jgi:peptide/nickel transport system permease protein
MVAFIVRRLFYAVVIITCATVVAFTLIRIIPGNPARLISPNASQEQIDQLTKRLGYDEPIPVQFLSFVKDAAQGDFGRSLFLKQDVATVIATSLPYTLVLASTALAIALVVGIGLGTLAAFQRDKIMDRIVLGISVLGQSMPGFWVGLVLILLVSVKLGWLPAFGYEGPSSLVLPSLALALSLLATLIRTSRLVMLDVLSQDYISAAHSRGLKRGSIVIRYALANIWVPILTVVGVQIGFVLGNAVVIEYIFNFPGLGHTILNAVLRRDYPVVQAVTILMAVGFVGINTIIDLSYGFLDPRIRKELSN